MMQLATLDPVLRAMLRAALGLLLLWAAGHKLRDIASFRQALAGYRLFPERWTAGVAALVVALELGIGVSLLTPGLGPAPALAGAALLSLYGGAIAINLARGRRGIDCGCAGPAARRPLHAGLVARNALLVTLAALVALPGAARELVWLDAVTLVAGVTLFGLLYAAADLALANAERLRELRGRA
jgi:hypothetical protein